MVFGDEWRDTVFHEQSDSLFQLECSGKIGERLFVPSLGRIRIQTSHIRIGSMHAGPDAGGQMVTRYEYREPLYLFPDPTVPGRITIVVEYFDADE